MTLSGLCGFILTPFGKAFGYFSDRETKRVRLDHQNSVQWVLHSCQYAVAGLGIALVCHDVV